MGNDLSYCILFLSYFIFVSSNPDKDSQVDVLSQGFDRETDSINSHETIAERVCKFLHGCRTFKERVKETEVAKKTLTANLEVGNFFTHPPLSSLDDDDYFHTVQHIHHVHPAPPAI